MLPTDAQYVAVASRSAVTCALLDAAGASLGEQSATPVGTEPGKIFFGSATNGVSLAGPAALRCDAPVYGTFEDPVSDGETLMSPSMAHRASSSAAISVVPDSDEQSRFEPGVSTIDTPALGLPTPGESIQSLMPTATVEAGAALGWRVSLDGGPWMVPSRGELVEAAGRQSAEPEAFAGVALGGAMSIAVQAVFETDGLAETTVEELDLVLLAQDASETSGDPSESSTGADSDTTATTTGDTADTTNATASTTDGAGDTTSADGSTSSMGTGTSDSGAQGADTSACGCKSASPPWSIFWLLLVVAVRRPR